VTKILRKELLSQKVVIVDGQPGCGKTMLSPIVSSFDRVELLNYAFEIEFICRLYKMKKIESDAAIALVRMFVDHKLYQTMMGREVNFRYSDLSSAFKDSNPWRYFRRIFQEGDLIVPERIKKEKPILNLTTHDLLQIGKPVFDGLGKNLVLIEVVRHPLYMVIQQQLNMERLVENPRDIQVCFEYKSRQLPFYALGWEEKFIKSNSMDKAVFAIERATYETDKIRKISADRFDVCIITIPFEKFVKEPWPYLTKIENALGTNHSKNTLNIMKKQKVPRIKISDSPALDIYKRCGWIPPQKVTEEGELEVRREMVVKFGSKEALKKIDMLSKKYTEQYT